MGHELFDRFIEAIAGADADGIATTLAPNVRLRALIPPGPREDEGPEAVAVRFVDWFGGYESSEVVAAAHEAFAGRVRVVYHVRLQRDGATWEAEQHAF